MKSRLTVWEAASIVTGYGVGGGIMAMPYLAARNGVIMSLAILVGSYLISLLMHFMVADLSLRAGGGQIVAVYDKFLFRGRFKKFWTLVFFIMVALVMLTTLATYITGAGEILTEYLHIGTMWSRIIFYVAAASVVLFGLKAVGVSEKIAVSLIFVLLAVFAVASFLNIRNPLPVKPGSWNEALAFFGMAMFAFVAFFSVPQAVEGLGGDVKKIRRAIVLGFINNFAIILVVTLCSLLASTEVTPLAMLGWSDGIGTWAQVVGSSFILLAIITTYWSISLALSDIIRVQIKLDHRFSWLLATFPTLLLALWNQEGFMEFMRMAGGLNAILIAILIVPTFRGADKDGPTRMLGRFASLPAQLFVVLAYIVMAIGSVVQI